MNKNQPTTNSVDAGASAFNRRPAKSMNIAGSRSAFCKKEHRIMGAIFKVPGYIVYYLGGLWGLFTCLGIVKAKLGIIGVIVGLIIFPVVIYLAPLYAAFADSNWMPSIVVYGSGIVAMILIGIGSAFDEKN